MEFLRPRRANLSLDMAPLIDVVFQLLIFFMLSSSFLGPSLRLDLPRAVVTDPSASRALVVSIDKSGLIFVNRTPASMNELKPLLKGRLEGDPQKAVHVRGDQEMAYKHFVTVMDHARQAGARQIYIAHEPGKDG